MYIYIYIQYGNLFRFLHSNPVLRKEIIRSVRGGADLEEVNMGVDLKVPWGIFRIASGLYELQSTLLQGGLYRGLDWGVSVGYSGV